MKTQLSLSELAQQIERNAENKKDYLANTEALTMQSNGHLAVNGQSEAQDLVPTQYAHKQIASRLGIPQKYYERMYHDDRGLLAQNVNAWFQHTPEKRMIRTLDGKMRAFLSNRYKVVEHEDIMTPIFEQLSHIPDLHIASCAITDTKLYLKVVTPRIEAEVTKGDIVQAGVVFSNSEVGAGAISATPLVYRLVCLNGMISDDNSFRSAHLGAQHGKGQLEDFVELQADTLKADAEAIALKVRDFTTAALDPVKFQERVNLMRETTTRKIEGDPVKAVEVVQKKYSLTGNEKSGIMKHLIEGGDLSQWGVLNAVTRTSQDIGDYDRATDFEQLGGKILNLAPKDWNEIAQAA